MTDKEKLIDICALCGEECDWLAGNPGMWPIFFCHPDGTGEPKPHHTQCVQEKVFGFEELMDVLRSLDCGDNSCLFKSSGGMRTNGGCRDTKCRHNAAKALHKISKKYKELL